MCKNLADDPILLFSCPFSTAECCLISVKAKKSEIRETTTQNTFPHLQTFVRFDPKPYSTSERRKDRRICGKYRLCSMQLGMGPNGVFSFFKFSGPLSSFVGT